MFLDSKTRVGFHLAIHINRDVFLRSTASKKEKHMT